MITLGTLKHLFHITKSLMYEGLLMNFDNDKERGRNEKSYSVLYKTQIIERWWSESNQQLKRHKKLPPDRCRVVAFKIDFYRYVIFLFINHIIKAGVWGQVNQNWPKGGREGGGLGRSWKEWHNLWTVPYKVTIFCWLIMAVWTLNLTICKVSYSRYFIIISNKGERYF